MPHLLGDTGSPKTSLPLDEEARFRCHFNARQRKFRLSDPHLCMPMVVQLSWLGFGIFQLEKPLKRHPQSSLLFPVSKDPNV